MWSAAHTASLLDHATGRCHVPRSAVTRPPPTHNATDYGFDKASTHLDFKLLKDRRDAYVRRLNGIYARNFEKAGVELVTGWGSLGDVNQDGVSTVVVESDGVGCICMCACAGVARSSFSFPFLEI